MPSSFVSSAVRSQFVPAFGLYAGTFMPCFVDDALRSFSLFASLIVRERAESDPLYFFVLESQLHAG